MKFNTLFFFIDRLSTFLNYFCLIFNIGVNTSSYTPDRNGTYRVEVQCQNVSKRSNDFVVKVDGVTESYTYTEVS